MKTAKSAIENVSESETPSEETETVSESESENERDSSEESEALESSEETEVLESSVNTLSSSLSMIKYLLFQMVLRVNLLFTYKISVIRHFNR